MDELDHRRRAVLAAPEPPGPVLLAVALDRDSAVLEQFEAADRADAAAPCAGADDVLAQFVVQHPKRQVGLDILDRIVARVGVERVDGVHPVLADGGRHSCLP